MSELQLTFTAFVISLASTAAIHFGDLPDPLSGERAEPNLDGAAQMIEILALLDEKTRGNLTAEERQMLEQVLYELRLRFVTATGAGNASSNRRTLLPSHQPSLRVTVLGAAPPTECRQSAATAPSAGPRTARSPHAAVDPDRDRAGGRTTLPTWRRRVPQPCGRILGTRRPTCARRHWRTNVRRVDAILFTHCHADHVFGLDDVRRYNQMQKAAIPC